MKSARSPPCFALKRMQKGRASEVLYYDRDGKEQAQKVKAVIVSANGAESARLCCCLRMNAIRKASQTPAVLSVATSCSTHMRAQTPFSNTRLMSSRAYRHREFCMTFTTADEKRGFYGGGGIDARALWSATPIFHAWLGMPPDVPRWGKAFKDEMAQ